MVKTSGIVSELWDFGSQKRIFRGTPVVLLGRVQANAGSRRWTTMRRFGTTVGYKVAENTTLVITRLLIQARVSGIKWVTGCGDTDIGHNFNFAPANPVLIDDPFGDPFGEAVNVLHTLDSNRLLDVNYYCEIPSGCFPFITHASASEQLIVQAFGIEI